ncbi:MAG: ABC transporter ATP-binding protein [Chloroflexi bacterium]|nr:ABC transporter ATP-binding protein [Chloroflexota bacterium]
MNETHADVAVWAEGILHTYSANQQRVVALDGVSLQIPWGGVTAIVGPSGSGKSTLLHLIGGLTRPLAGQLIVNGKNLRELTSGQLAYFRSHDIGMIFQSFNLLPGLTVGENVYFPLYFNREGFTNRHERVRALLDAVGLGHAEQRRPVQLSGGEQQRVAIARALITNPPLILADEPTGNLDDVTGQTIMSLLFQLAHDYSKTLVLVTHHREYSCQANRRIYIEHGHITPEEDV